MASFSLFCVSFVLRESSIMLCARHSHVLSGRMYILPQFFRKGRQTQAV